MPALFPADSPSLWQALATILTFHGGYNTAVVLIGASAIGVAAGVVGVFVLLRKRALVGDAIAHATLPGVGIGFLVAYGLGLDEGRHLPTLLAGAALTGLAGALAIQWIVSHTRLPEDAAIGSVLSVFFGVGTVLFSALQGLSAGNRAGLEAFLLGQTAALGRADAELIVGAGLVVVVLALLFFKEFGLVCFDPAFAGSLGWPVGRLDLMIMALLLATVVVGLRTVGAVLVFALLIIPAVAARFWTERLGTMVLLAALFGGFSGYLGAALSAAAPRLPAGALIVMVAAGLFLISFTLAPRRGVLAQLWYRARARRTLGRPGEGTIGGGAAGGGATPTDGGRPGGGAPPPPPAGRKAATPC